MPSAHPQARPLSGQIQKQYRIVGQLTIRRGGTGATEALGYSASPDTVVCPCGKLQ
jgi:hypothetical protein